MPLIEELPVVSTIKASHGWAYVPDTGPIAAQQPGTRERKRAIVGVNRSAASTTAKREKAIQLRLDSLNKENYRDGVSVPIPPRASASVKEKPGQKMTSNVRRILGYQRNFAHYLADVEANHPGMSTYVLPNLPTAMAPPPTPLPATTTKETLARSASKDKNLGRRRSGARRSLASTTDTSQPTTPTEASQSRGTKRGRTTSRSMQGADKSSPATETPVKKEDQLEEPEQKDVTMTDVSPTLSSSQPQPSAPSEVIPDYPALWDTDPLLESSPAEVPVMPTDRIMQILISEPPLTYTAAKATPLDEEKQVPPRHFCSICGYWGKVRCRKCDEWTCGLMDCYKSHEAVCVNANAY